MNEVFAFIVGIEKYKQPRWNVSGPCANALAIAKWLRSIEVPGKNIYLFVDVHPDQNHDATLSALEADEVHVNRSADSAAIDTFWREELRKERPANSRLLIYWSGHGYADKDGSRIFICHDYTSAELTNRVFDGSNFLRLLRATDYQRFSEQIFLADVCAQHEKLEFATDKTPPKDFAKNTRQVAYFATPEGQYAKGANGRGVFTQVVLNVLGQSNRWPSLDAFGKAMQDAFESVGQTPFYVRIEDSKFGNKDRFCGFAPERISLSRLPQTGAQLFGREEALRFLDECWDDQTVHVVSLVAWGGVGKSALVNGWLRQMASNGYRGAKNVFGWSFYSQGTTHKTVSADLFIEEALRWFGDSDPQRGSDWDRAQRLSERVREKKTLLILDGLEPLQYPPGQDEGKVKDEARAVRFLLTELAASNTGLCVISTRINVADLANYESSTTRRKDLEQLEPDAGARLLAAMGVRGEQEDLRLTSSEFAGHALALTLLGSYLVDACEGDVRRRGEIARLQKDERLGGHARRVMESYEGWFGAGPEVSVLRMVGLFDRPAEGDAIGVLRAPPPIPGLTESLQDLGHVGWNRLLDKLRRARLIAQNNTQNPDTVDAHPLIREHFGEQLSQSYPDAWTKGHERLLEYSIRRGVDKPETVEQMTPTFEAVVHACEAGRHSEALQLYRTRILRGEEYYSTYKLSAFGNEMAILYHFFEDEWGRPMRSLNNREKAFVLHQVGYCQRARGILPQSVAWLEQALAAYEALGDKEQCLKVTGLLSATYLTLGDLTKALSHARKSVELSDTSASNYDMWVNRTKLADVYHNAANLDHARQLFGEAEAFLHREKPHWYLYGFSGFKFMDLLLSLRDFRAVRERGEWMLRWVEENPRDPSATKLTTALANLAIGYSYFLDSTLDNSTQLVQSKLYFDRALDFLLQTDRQELLVRGWLARGEIALANGDPKTAKASFEMATSVAERGDMKLRRVDCLLDFARLYLAFGDRDSASANLKSAAMLIQETKYFLRTSDLRDLERRIASP